MKNKRTVFGFTIVELLIVVVVIAILATIVIIAYNGVTNRAKESAAQSVVKSVSTKIFAYAVDNGDAFPASLATIGVADSASDTYQYSVNNSVSPRTFCVSVTRDGVSYLLSQSGEAPSKGTCGNPPIPTSTIYGSTNPGSVTLYNDGSSDIALGTVFYSTDTDFTVKGGRVYLPSIPSGSGALTICYVVGWWSGGTSIGMPTWSEIPSSIPTQCKSIDSTALHVGWNEALFPSTAVIHPFSSGVGGTSVWIVYYFANGNYYAFKPSVGDTEVQSSNNPHLYIPQEVGFAGDTRRSAFGGRSGGPGDWSKHFYAIDIMTEGP